MVSRTEHSTRHVWKTSPLLAVLPFLMEPKTALPFFGCSITHLAKTLRCFSELLPNRASPIFYLWAWFFITAYALDSESCSNLSRSFWILILSCSMLAIPSTLCVFRKFGEHNVTAFISIINKTVKWHCLSTSRFLGYLLATIISKSIMPTSFESTC